MEDDDLMKERVERSGPEHVLALHLLSMIVSDDERHHVQSCDSWGGLEGVYKGRSPWNVRRHFRMYYVRRRVHEEKSIERYDGCACATLNRN